MAQGGVRASNRNPLLLLRLACAAGCLLVCGRLLYEAWTGQDSSLVGRGNEHLLVWVAYLGLGTTLGLLLYRSRRVLPPNWVVGAFSISLVCETLGHMALSRTFGNVPAGVLTALEIVGALAAAATAMGLPIYFEGLQRLAKVAAASSRNEARLVAAAESSLDALLMFSSVHDGDGRIVDFRLTFLNHTAEQLLGNGREMKGRLLGESYPVLLEAGRIEQFRRVVETGEPMVLETESPVLLSLQRPAYCRIHAVKLEDGIAVSVSDLTEIRAASQELQRALAFNKGIVSSSPFSIVVSDLEGRITMVNPAAERMLWYSAEELRGANLTLLHDQQEIARRARELGKEMLRPVAATSEVFRLRAEMGLRDESEWTYIRKDGSRLPVQLTMSAVEDEAGHIVGLMGMAYDLTERKQTDDYIQHLAHHDPLTGLPSRTLLRDRLEVEVERGKRFQGLFAVLMIDLDHFKRVNDSLGHQAGDAVLCEVAERLKHCLRKVDTVARFGGDEFVVLLTELRSRGHAEAVARKIIAALATPVKVGGHEITVTASIGLSLFPDSGEPDELLKHADIAMYRSKALGRNELAVFTPGLGQELMERLKMESALRTALERHELSVVYQPQVAMESGELTGVEALLRWHSPVLGEVAPTVFIPIAEETGLILAMGSWVLRTACAEMAGLQKELGRALTVAVNLSPRQIQQADFHETVAGALAETGLAAECLEVEITEHMLMRDSDQSLAAIERVQSLGVSVAIDDFGTGFSNMSYITRFKIDRLKIDRSFIERCVEDGNSHAVTTAIVALAHSLQMTAVAEGVETEAQRRLLRELQCDYAQGFLYARPMTLEALRALLGGVEEAAAEMA